MSKPGAVVAGRYRLVSRIGVGGMGSVWEALDERLQRTVALKLLHTRPGISDAEAQVATDRAMREGRITARLHHPHAVPVFDVVEHEGQPCLVMQYLPSRTLQQVLTEKGPLPPDEVALIGAEVGGALAAAHAAGIVHRDIKPANILLTEDGSAMITDFGISHALGDATLTSTGMVTGTPAYFAPEVARGAESSFASDVFSLGATLYAALEGRPPFGTDDNAIALLHRVASGAITAPTRAAGLTPVLLGMLAASAQDRPAMAEAAAALERVDVGAAAGATAVLPTATPPQPAVGGPSPATSVLPAVVAGSAGGPPVSDDVVPVDGPPDRRRARTALIILAVVLALGLASVFAIQTLRGDGPTVQPSGSVTTTPTSAAPSSAPPTTSAAPTTTKSSPTPTEPSPTTAPTTPSATTTSDGGAPTAEELAAAITHYYGLLPGDTKTGYSLLTDRFRTEKSPTFESYASFWDDYDRVDATDAVGTAPGLVEATIRYVRDDGRVIVERTAYSLVEDGGVLKIDTSRVVRRLS